MNNLPQKAKIEIFEKYQNNLLERIKNNPFVDFKKYGCKESLEFDKELDVLRYKKLDKLKLLYTDGCKIDPYIFTEAAKIGNLEMMKWLRSVDCPMEESTFAYAVLHGNLMNMEWLLDIDCPCESTALLDAAIENGNLEIIKWVRTYYIA